MSALAVPEADVVPAGDRALSTWLSLERTLMSWIRTCATVIGLGFSISKIFDFLHELENKAPSRHVLGYRTYALVLVGIGVFALVAAIVQHRRLVRRWWPHEQAPPFSLATTIAVMFAVFGVAIFVAVLLGY